MKNQLLIECLLLSMTKIVCCLFIFSGTAKEFASYLSMQRSQPRSPLNPSRNVQLFMRRSFWTIVVNCSAETLHVP